MCPIYMCIPHSYHQQLQQLPYFFCMMPEPNGKMHGKRDVRLV